MVSILSFFTKKRPKSTTAAPPSPPRDETRRPISPTSPRKAAAPASRPPQRFKSLRQPGPSASTVRGDAARRASADLPRRSGSGGAQTKKRASILPGTDSTPPRLVVDLPFEAQSDQQLGGGLSLGLDGVGRTPTLSHDERRALDAQRYTPADLAAAWEWLGPELTERGASCAAAAVAFSPVPPTTGCGRAGG